MPYGSGKYTYELDQKWAKLPAGVEFGQVTAAATDSKGNVYVFNRSDRPMFVFDRQGNYLTDWGAGIFGNRSAHGLVITPDDTLYCTDWVDHVVQKMTTDGRVLGTMGTKGVPADSGYVVGPNLIAQLDTITHAGPPFNQPTKLMVAANGDMFATDGYGNAAVHHFSADGKLIKTWGGPGQGPGQFKLPHGLWVSKDGKVYVADRENSRVQVFTSDGQFIEEWANWMRPADVFIDPDGMIYVAEIDGRITITDPNHKIVSRFGETPDPTQSPVRTAHSIWVDDRGDIYLGLLGTGPKIEKLVRQ